MVMSEPWKAVPLAAESVANLDAVLDVSAHCLVARWAGPWAVKKVVETAALRADATAAQ